MSHNIAKIMQSLWFWQFRQQLSFSMHKKTNNLFLKLKKKSFEDRTLAKPPYFLFKQCLNVCVFMIVAIPSPFSRTFPHTASWWIMQWHIIKDVGQLFIFCIFTFSPHNGCPSLVISPTNLSQGNLFSLTDFTHSKMSLPVVAPWMPAKSNQ